MLFHKLNSFVRLLILLFFTIVCGFLAFLTILYYPSAPGRLPYNNQIERISRFPRWNISLDNKTHLFFPDGGTIIHAYEDNRLHAVVIRGRLKYFIRDIDHADLDSHDTNAVFIALSDQKLEELKGDTIFTPVENRFVKENQTDFFKNHPRLPVITGFGFPRIFPPPENTFYMHFLSGNQRSIPYPIFNEEEGRVASTALFYSLATAIILLMILILSLGHKPSKSWKTFINRPLKPVEGLLILIFLALTFFTKSFTHSDGLGSQSTLVAYGAGALLLLLMAYYSVSVPHLGLTLATSSRAFVPAVAIAVILAFLAAFRFPVGVAEGTLSDHLGQFLFPFLVIAFGRELLWRGYIQATLTRLAGPFAGLTFTALLAGGLHLLFLYYFEPNMLLYPFSWLEGLLFAPASALILGLLYYRTGSILSSTLLHTLMLFLPGFLIF